MRQAPKSGVTSLGAVIAWLLEIQDLSSIELIMLGLRLDAILESLLLKGAYWLKMPIYAIKKKIIAFANHPNHEIAMGMH